MLNRFWAQFQQPKRKFRSYVWRTVGNIVPVLLIAGCSQAQLPVILQQKPLQNVDLQWRVNQSSQPGSYQIAGQTNLPDQTQLTVAALRYLYPLAAANRKLNANPTYTILDYQSAVVQSGKWQTRLNLWQVAADGTFQENWQMEQQGLATRFNPQSEVVFLVSLAPIEQLSTLQQQLASEGQQINRSLLRSTSIGERYAQSQQILAIALPTGNTLAPPPQLEAENFGWGRRYLLPQEPQNPTKLERPSDRLTTAPARPEEFLR
ncbi:MAG: hypothetical protein HC827_08055 [Cyanobacteria bacterium RM1_2_2]|nr:hypothetical protein [Cyanobacteria bacterium RM1_2_2]